MQDERLNNEHAPKNNTKSTKSQHVSPAHTENTDRRRNLGASKMRLSSNTAIKKDTGKPTVLDVDLQCFQPQFSPFLELDSLEIKLDELTNSNTNANANSALLVGCNNDYTVSGLSQEIENNITMSPSSLDPVAASYSNKLFSPFNLDSPSSALAKKVKYSSPAVSASKKLTFLNNLVSVPTESDIHALTSLTASIKASINVDQDVLLTALSSFGRMFEEISSRANCWAWAPKYLSFIYKVSQETHAQNQNSNMARYCSALLSLLACLATNFDSSREPTLQRYFVKKIIPRLVDQIGQSRTKVDIPSLALVYIFFQIETDEHVVGFLLGMRRNSTQEEFFSDDGRNKILRYRRALWFGSVCNRLFLQLNQIDSIMKEIDSQRKVLESNNSQEYDKTEEIDYKALVCNENFIRFKNFLDECYEEAHASYSEEKEVVIRNAYNKFFYFNDKK